MQASEKLLFARTYYVRAGRINVPDGLIAPLNYAARPPGLIGRRCNRRTRRRPAH
jgi:hypothetical protein